MPPLERTNVLRIMTDQQRYDTLGCNGAPTCRTPAIDAIAEKGVRFSSAYTPTSPCSPARAALFTGLYPHKDNVLSDGGIVNPNVPNLADTLAGAGYGLTMWASGTSTKPKCPVSMAFMARTFPDTDTPL